MAVSWSGTSIFVTTAVSTKIESVTCTEYNCLTQKGSSNSPAVPNSIETAHLTSSGVPNSIETSYLTSSGVSNSIETSYLTSSGVSNSIETSYLSISSAPNIETSVELTSVPSIITTNDVNKANTLAFSGLAILLLQFI